jgi:hypothetical protein
VIGVAPPHNYAHPMLCADKIHILENAICQFEYLVDSIPVDYPRPLCFIQPVNHHRHLHCVPYRGRLELFEAASMSHISLMRLPLQQATLLIG